MAISTQTNLKKFIIKGTSSSKEQEVMLKLKAFVIILLVTEGSGKPGKMEKLVSYSYTLLNLQGPDFCTRLFSIVTEVDINTYTITMHYIQTLDTFQQQVVLQIFTVPEYTRELLVDRYP